MENITLGQIAAGVAFLAALIAGVGALLANIKKWITKAMEEPLNEIRDEIKTLRGRIDEVDMESSKNFLVNFLAEVDKGQPIDEVEKERFFEQYQHYSKNGGNSYIKHKVEKLQNQGKL